jgi:DNA-binding transcriptional LysR family regulator
VNVFRLTKLRHFCTVAEHSSIGLAARVLRISQPALTRSIHRLESEFDEPLFERSPRGVMLTQLGATLLPHAKAILAEADRATEDWDNLKGKQRARINVGISPNFVRYVIPEVLEAFVAEYPEASIEVQTGTAEQLLAMLSAAQLDLAVAVVWRGTLDAALGRVMDIWQTRLARLSAGVYAPRGHPLAATGAATLQELATYRWAVPHSLSISYVFQNVFVNEDLVAPLQVINTSHLSLMVPACVRLNLLTIVPRHVMTDEVARGDMVPVACPALELDYAVSLLSRRRSTTTSALNEFVAMLKTHFDRRHA